MQKKIIATLFLLYLGTLICPGSSFQKPLRKDSLLSLSLTVNPAISMQKSRIKHSLLEKNYRSLNAGLDSLLKILGSSSFLFQKGEVAQYLMDLLTGEAFSGYNINAEGQSHLVLQALRHSENACFRVEQLLNATDGRLLLVNGNEAASIGKITHSICLYLGDLIIKKDNGRDLKDYLNKMVRNKSLSDYYKENCS